MDDTPTIQVGLPVVFVHVSESTSQEITVLMSYYL